MMENFFATSCQSGLRMLAGFDLNAVLNAYPPVSLAAMEGVALLNRVDTKYLLSMDQLIRALHNVQHGYRILTIGQHRIHPYWTLYYDTPGFKLYHDQVTGRADIFKVRSREYLDTRQFYLEVKHKNQKKRTEKYRLPIACHTRCLDQQMLHFVQQLLPLRSRALEPKLWNTFQRITLVSKTDFERLTIDLEMSFFNGQQGKYLAGIAVAEVKQDQYSHVSAFMCEMRRQGIRQTGFSKYCFGIAQLYAHVKKNTQKERLLMVQKIQHGGQRYVCFA